MNLKSEIKNLLGDKFFSNYLRMRYSIYKKRLIPDMRGIIYTLNGEEGLLNLKSREINGKIEYADMIAANKAIGLYFVSANSSIHRVVNIGSGLGTFENINAPIHPEIHFFASEMDEESTEWARANRQYANVKYCTDSISSIIEKEDKFDLAVSVDVIEHIADYKSFLDDFSLLADKAIITTPNRDRYRKVLNKPTWKYHVQEFNAGELFFILKMYYSKVELYSAPDINKPTLVPVGLYSTYNKLFAYCER